LEQQLYTREINVLLDTIFDKEVAVIMSIFQKLGICTLTRIREKNKI